MRPQTEMSRIGSVMELGMTWNVKSETNEAWGLAAQLSNDLLVKSKESQEWATALESIVHDASHLHELVYGFVHRYPSRKIALTDDCFKLADDLAVSLAQTARSNSINNWGSETSKWWYDVWMTVSHIANDVTRLRPGYVAPKRPSVRVNKKAVTV